MATLIEIMGRIATDKNPASDKPSIVYATVISSSPIEIMIDGYTESIPEDFIITGALCRRYVLPKPHKHNDVAPDTPQTDTETEEIEVWRGLQSGDRVICLKINEGQIYYIIQRVEMEGFR